MTLPETGPSAVFVVEIVGRSGQRDYTVYEEMEQALREHESAEAVGAWSRVLAYEPARVVAGPASYTSTTAP